MTALHNTEFEIEKRGLIQAFDHVAGGYEQHAILQRTVMERILERLDVTTLKAGRVLDLGSGTGLASRLLAQRYKKSQIVQLDLSPGMLRESRSRSPRFFSRQRYICADAEMLPMADRSIDLVFSNLMLQWCNDLDSVFTGAGRVLRPEGLFIFATLGPDTLKELRLSWEEVDRSIHVNTFLDMHDVGDALMRAGFDAPVLDVEHITLAYEDGYKLMRELKNLGAHNINAGRRRTLTGKNRMQKMLATYEQFRQDGRLPATYEVVYGHAWMVDRPFKTANADKVVSIPVDSIRRRKGYG